MTASGQARSAWLAAITRHGLQVDALNAWGNPLHPDKDLAREHDRALRDAIRLATLLGVDRVVALAGCPGGTAGDQVPHFGAGGWLPYLEGVYQRQWEEQIAPYWSGLAGFAAAENPALRVCLELHPRHLRVQRRDVPPGGRVGTGPRRQPRPEPLLLDGHGRP